MKLTICVIAFSLVLALSPAVAQAATNPPVNGAISGIELCPQFICGAAYFAAGFQGQIGANPSASGIVATAINHGELPTVIGDSTPIYAGGLWQLRSLFRGFGGIVLGGRITYIGSNRFHVTVALLETVGGSGTLSFDGILDHNPLIPTIAGILH